MIYQQLLLPISTANTICHNSKDQPSQLISSEHPLLCILNTAENLPFFRLYIYIYLTYMTIFGLVIIIWLFTINHHYFIKQVFNGLNSILCIRVGFGWFSSLIQSKWSYRAAIRGTVQSQIPKLTKTNYDKLEYPNEGSPCFPRLMGIVENPYEEFNDESVLNGIRKIRSSLSERTEGDIPHVSSSPWDTSIKSSDAKSSKQVWEILQKSLELMEQKKIRFNP